jgi:hypothetical protein
MARKRSRASGTVATPVTDDFKLIKGIGSSFERQLHNAGIDTYERLASLTSVEIADVITGLSIGQIEKQNWIGQAGKLATKRAAVHSRRSKSQERKTSPGHRQHYATFTVELLLDEVNTVRRSRVAHIQSGEEDTWAGWQGMQLINFLKKQAGLRVSENKPDQHALPPGKRARMPAVRNLKGTLHISNLSLLPANSQTPVFVLQHEELYTIHITLDLREVVVPHGIPLVYKATIIAEQAQGLRHLIGEASDNLISSETVTIILEGINLPPNIYRLESVITLTPHSLKPGPETTLMAFHESSPLEIY